MQIVHCPCIYLSSTPSQKHFHLSHHGYAQSSLQSVQVLLVHCRHLGQPLTQSPVELVPLSPKYIIHFVHSPCTLFVHLVKFATHKSLFVSTLLRMFQLPDKTIIPPLLPKLNAQPASIQSSNTWGRSQSQEGSC